MFAGASPVLWFRSAWPSWRWQNTTAPTVALSSASTKVGRVKLPPDDDLKLLSWQDTGSVHLIKFEIWIVVKVFKSAKHVHICDIHLSSSNTTLQNIFILNTKYTLHIPILGFKGITLKASNNKDHALGQMSLDQFQKQLSCILFLNATGLSWIFTLGLNIRRRDNISL